jgi:beta-barrel assembly-enhancing protease
MRRKRMATVGFAAIVSIAVRAAGFDWQSLVPPPSGGSEASQDSATGSAGARGIDEGGVVASRGGDGSGVERMESAEPDAAHVAKFIEKGGLVPGTAPPAESASRSAGSSGSGFTSFAQTLDPTGYAGAALKGAKGIIGFSAAEEHELGRRIAASVVAQYGLSRDHDAEEYTNLVAAVVGRNSTRPDIHYHVGVLDTDRVNAFSAPGGYLFVTHGALSLIEDEAELGGVLGHEIGHVTGRHVLRELQRANLLGGALSAARTRGFTSSQYDQLVGFSTQILSRGLDRKDELAADADGVAFATSAGYGSEGLTRFLKRLQDRERKRSSGLFPTHPPAADRIAALQALGHASATDHRLTERFRRFIAAR